MPCSDGGWGREPSPQDVEAINFGKRAPGLICSACRVLERMGYDFDENPELSDYWAKHKAADNARIANEAVARARHEAELVKVTELLAKPVGTLSKSEIQMLRSHGKI